MAKKYMSVDKTLKEFARTLPLYLLGIVVVTVLIGVVDKDWSALPFVAGFIVALAPLFWLRGQASDDGPTANPRVLPLAIGWAALCIALFLLLA